MSCKKGTTLFTTGVLFIEDYRQTIKYQRNYEIKFTSQIMILPKKLMLLTLILELIRQVGHVLSYNKKKSLFSPKIASSSLISIFKKYLYIQSKSTKVVNKSDMYLSRLSCAACRMLQCPFLRMKRGTFGLSGFPFPTFAWLARLKIPYFSIIVKTKATRVRTSNSKACISAFLLIRNVAPRKHAAKKWLINL